MQQSFDFVASDVPGWRDRLRLPGIAILPARRRTPAGQLVKSLISGRTRDAVSLAAYRQLGACYGSLARLAAADHRVVAHTIAAVTFPEAKAAHLVQTLRAIAREEIDFRLDFLGNWPVGDALVWLERLPGVAGKVAASTLNASTLNRPVMIVDTHVLRVLVRLGFVDRRCDFGEASRAVTAAAPSWSGDDFLEFHILMKRLGQTVCRHDVPLCEACPLAADCPTGILRGQASST